MINLDKNRENIKLATQELGSTFTRYGKKQSSLDQLQTVMANVIFFRLWEGGILRTLYDPIIVSPESCIHTQYDDRKVFPVDLLNYGIPAVSTTTYASPELQIYNGKRVMLSFIRYISNRIRKSEIELQGLSYQALTILVDQQVKALQNQEDVAWFNIVDEVIRLDAASNTATVPIGSTTAFKDALAAGGNIFAKKYLYAKKVVMNRVTKSLMLRETTFNIGDAQVAELGSQGIDVIKNYMNYEIITTIKDDIIPDNVMYFFADSSYTGGLYIQSDVKTHMETKEGIISFYSELHSVPALLNSNAVGKVTIE